MSPVAVLLVLLIIFAAVCVYAVAISICPSCGYIIEEDTELDDNALTQCPRCKNVFNPFKRKP